MRYTTTHIVTALLALTLLVLTGQGLYIVPEGKQALLFQFGKIMGEAKQEAGLYMKIPFIQKVKFLEKRILNWDGLPETIPTGDKKFIKVDTTARWKIDKPILFVNKLYDFNRAQSKIKNIIDSATRDVISSNNLVEAVRNTNAILDKRTASLRKKNDIDTIDLSEDEISGEIRPVEIGREQLSQMIINIARPQLQGFGITLIDVQLRRIAYEESVEEKVYDRMISERKRIAEKIISFGKGEQAKIRGKIAKDLQQIRSEAYREVQEIKGTAEADAISIYAGAIKGHEDFYEFLRTLEVYETSLRSDTSFILSSDSRLMSLLSKGSSSKE